MWRSVLLHEFPDENIDSLQALPGDLTAESLALNPRRGAIKITPLRRFQYVLRDPLNDVIGVSCRVRVRYPYEGPADPEPILQLGGDIQLAVRMEPDFRARVRVRVGQTELRFGVTDPLHPSFSEIRFDWHTSGQAHLRSNGRLVGYHNALSPAGRLTVPDVALGRPFPGISPSFQDYEISRVFVRVLRRPDALALLSHELPVIEAGDDDLLKRCRVQTMRRLLAKLDRIRSFMTSINSTLSQPWPNPADPNGEPFAPEGVLAHDLANQAVTKLWEMLRSGDFTAREDFLGPFTGFLEILRQTSPAEFAQLAAELRDTPTVPEECRAVFEKATEPARQGVAPLLALLTEASERIDEIA